MEIKLGQHNRIRLDEQDYANLQHNLSITQEFAVTAQLKLTLTVALNASGADSTIISHAASLKFNLSETDFSLLNAQEQRKNGIVLGTYTMQLDAWTAKKRAPHQMDSRQNEIYSP